jgi:hypothetical protein
MTAAREHLSRAVSTFCESRGIPFALSIIKADLSSQIRLMKQQLFAAGSVPISLRPSASGALKLSEREEDATYQEPFQELDLMVDASGRR